MVFTGRPRRARPLGAVVVELVRRGGAERRRGGPAGGRCRTTSWATSCSTRRGRSCPIRGAALAAGFVEAGPRERTEPRPGPAPLDRRGGGGRRGSAQRERAQGLLRECETAWLFRQPPDEARRDGVALGLARARRARTSRRCPRGRPRSLRRPSIDRAVPARRPRPRLHRHRPRHASRTVHNDRPILGRRTWHGVGRRPKVTTRGTQARCWSSGRPRWARRRRSSMPVAAALAGASVVTSVKSDVVASDADGARRSETVQVLEPGRDERVDVESPRGGRTLRHALRVARDLTADSSRPWRHRILELTRHEAGGARC